MLKAWGGFMPREAFGILLQNYEKTGKKCYHQNR